MFCILSDKVSYKEIYSSEFEFVQEALKEVDDCIKCCSERRMGTGNDHGDLDKASRVFVEIEISVDLKVAGLEKSQTSSLVKASMVHFFFFSSRNEEN